MKELKPRFINCVTCSVELTAEDIDNGYCTNCGTIIYPGKSVVAKLLKARFTWLGTDLDAGSGADVIGALAAFYDELTPSTKKPRKTKKRSTKPPRTLKCQNCGEKADGGSLRVVYDTVVERSIISYSPGLIIANGMVESYANEESESGDRLECSSCGHEFPIPENVRVDYD
jgi:predicted RNA-binding Zn-ribbon protein involved in translation (DUF1610 family)